MEQKYKILIVDDEQSITDMLKLQLEFENYMVYTAGNAEEAMEKLSHSPDLILLDYEMPVCDGSQVLEMIRSEEDFADIPVIFLTGSVEKDRVKKVVALKPEGYLLKTLPPVEIKKNIDSFFQGAQG